MKLETLIVKETPRSLTLTINRLPQKNSINTQLLHDINAALDYAQTKTTCHMVIFEGQEKLFCTGMDFPELIQLGSAPERERIEAWAKLYMGTLKRLTTIPKVIVCKVDGKAIAGGTGLVAASDIAIATDKAQFRLSEALWGLVPAIISPFLIRRTGFQKTYVLTLTTASIDAQEALSYHLIDKHTNTPDEYIEEILDRISLVQESVLQEIKSYFRQMWIITDEMEKNATEKTIELFLSQRVQENVRHFLNSGRLPWEALHI